MTLPFDRNECQELLTLCLEVESLRNGVLPTVTPKDYKQASNCWKMLVVRVDVL